MKKVLWLAAAIFMFGLIIGCDVIKDATDITFGITKNYKFTVQGDSVILPDSINIEDDDNYKKYKDKIREIKIDYIKYSITSNTGGGGTGDFYAGSYGSAYSDATKITETISFAERETRLETYIEWINKAHLESLLDAGKLSFWAVGNGSGVDIILPVEIRIEVTVNPLE